MELLRSLGGDFRMRMPPPTPQSQSLLGFSLDTHASLLESAAGGRLLFPFEDLKPAGSGANNDDGAAADQYEHSKDHQAAGDGDDTPGFWSNSVLGNGTSNGGDGPW
ncbi:unnamed protein product [Urochloa humidicola]